MEACDPLTRDLEKHACLGGSGGLCLAAKLALFGSILLSSYRLPKTEPGCHFGSRSIMNLSFRSIIKT